MAKDSQMNMTVELKKCCALCDHANREHCPAYFTVKAAEEVCNDNWEEVAKYEMVCDKFELNEHFKRDEL